MVCILTSSAAVSGSVSAAVHSMRCLASSNKLATIVGSVDFLAEDEICPVRQPVRPGGRGESRAKSVHEVFPFVFYQCFTLQLFQRIDDF
jgi:hypothetical protein